MNSVKFLPVIIIGVAIGGLIALYVAYQVAQKQIAQNANTSTLLSAALSKL